MFLYNIQTTRFVTYLLAYRVNYTSRSPYAFATRLCSLEFDHYYQGFHIKLCGL